jgi:predicted  nucleic acid-binding Zn-ribbon protein
MKQFISKVKNLSQKAAELKAAMQQVPPKVAEIREAVASTAGQLQQLRMDVQSTVANLKADNEHHISQAMQEINGSLDVFMEAGFELSGMDLEISPVQRLLVHLNRQEEVHPSALRSLISANQHRRTIHALLTSVLQAQEMADTVQLGELTKFDYRELIVSIGPIPSVRICWRPEGTTEAEEVAQPPETAPIPPPVTQIASTEPLSAFTQSSYFEKRTPLPLPTATTATTPPVAALAPKPIRVPLPTAESPGAETASTETKLKQDPLARFKKMPDLSRFTR